SAHNSEFKSRIWVERRRRNQVDNHRGLASGNAFPPQTKRNERILGKPELESNSSMARILATGIRGLPARSAASRRDRRGRRSARTRIDNDSPWPRALAP